MAEEGEAPVATPGLASSGAQELSKSPPANAKGVQFWLVFLGFCLAGFCLAGFIASTDATIIFTALPTISDELGGLEEYIWLGNAIAGGVHTAALFVSGRLVQGLGAGEMLGSVLGACAVDSLIGPVIGSTIVTRTTWRWAFWINMPVCALTLRVMVSFLRVSWKRSPSWMRALSRIDFIGNTIFVASITSILIGLVQSGVVHPWGSCQTILSIVIGFIGWAIFFVQQGFSSELTIPLRLFVHSTAATVYLQEFVVKYRFLPIDAFMIPSGAIAGAVLTKIGRYKPRTGLALACALQLNARFCCDCKGLSDVFLPSSATPFTLVDAASDCYASTVADSRGALQNAVE
ncbi:hypothetical protein SUNI508_07476 [Seiridium unicorne]|uniref:Uncharacterized protein n=1 Tax=Seiridium unicorne TaxID=138068 RepID=A0ABR2UWA3_9PEZI